MGDTAELVQQELKLHELLVNMIRNLEDDTDRPWESAAGRKRQLMEKQIRRYKMILQELEYLAPWTAGREGSDKNRELVARKAFMRKHSHIITCPYPPYPSSDDSSSDDAQTPRQMRPTSR